MAYEINIKSNLTKLMEKNSESKIRGSLTIEPFKNETNKAYKRSEAVEELNKKFDFEFNKRAVAKPKVSLPLSTKNSASKQFTFDSIKDKPVANKISTGNGNGSSV